MDVYMRAARICLGDLTKNPLVQAEINEEWIHWEHLLEIAETTLSSGEAALVRFAHDLYGAHRSVGELTRVDEQTRKQMIDGLAELMRGLSG